MCVLYENIKVCVRLWVFCAIKSERDRRYVSGINWRERERVRERERERERERKEE